MTQIIFSMIYLDCFICTFVLYFSYKYLIKQYNKFTIHNEKAKRRLQVHSFLLILASLFRLIFDAVFFVAPPSKKYTICIRNYTEITNYIIGYVLFGTYLMHFFPVVVCLDMYQPIEEKDP